jgi:predicted DNA-binding transcriptional regulator AlpA
MKIKSKEQFCATEDRSLTIEEFCLLENISKPTYYQMRKRGIGPAEMRVLNCVRISYAARMEWQREREKRNAPGYQEAASKHRERSARATAARHAPGPVEA